MKVILMYGLGCDGATILHEWMHTPGRRDFDWKDLVVLTAQTGNEWTHAAYLNEKYVYPRLAELGVRTVQIAKGGPKVKDGYVVLDDTRSPTTCFIRGSYTLGQHLSEVGTVPQFRDKNRWCSAKYKGLILDQWLEQESYSLGESLLESGVVPQFRNRSRWCSDQHKAEILQQWLVRDSWSLGTNLLDSGVVPQFQQGHRKCSDQYKRVPLNQWMDDNAEPMRVVIGFNADEQSRIDRAEFAVSQNPVLNKIRVNEFPLKTWGLGRKDTERISSALAMGELFWRSACCYCPFSGISGPTEEVLMKHRAYPEDSAFAMFVEFVSRCLNPKQTLYPGSRSLYQMIADDGNWPAIAAFERILDAVGWKLYRIRRIYGRGVPYRRLECVAVGSRVEMEAELKEAHRQQGGSFTDQPDGVARLYLERRSDGFDCEDMFVVAPGVVREKWRSGFSYQWMMAHQLSLF